MYCMDKKVLRACFTEWIGIERWQAPFAVTLTLRQSVTVANSMHPVRLSLTEQSASQNFRHFLNKLNRVVYGSAAHRFGKGVAVVPVIEDNADKRLHYHALIDCPRPQLVAAFPAAIADAWRSTQWGYYQIDIQSGADRGWLNYMMKFRDKPDFATAIDLMNLRLP